MKSVGDFYVNIIPKLDQIALNTGISAVNASINMAKQAWSTGKYYVGMAEDTARVIAEQVRLAKSLDMSFQKLNQLNKAFQLTGLSASDAHSTVASLIDSFHTMKNFGEADWFKLSAYGIADFRTGNPIQDLMKIDKLLQGRAIGEKRDIMAALGLSPDLLRIIGTGGFEALFKEARKYTISDKQAASSENFVKQIDKMDMMLEKFKATVITNVLPSMSNLIEKLNKLVSDKDFIKAAETLAEALILFISATSSIVSGAAKTATSFWERFRAGKAFVPSYAAQMQPYKIENKTTIEVIDKTDNGVKVNQQIQDADINNAKKRIETNNGGIVQ